MLSVIIVNYNTREYLRKCLTSLNVHEPLAQVIVVDNASRDGSQEMVRQDYPGVHLICEEQNRGFAAANNSGLEVAKGDYLVLFNSDAELTDAALSECVKLMESNPKLGAVHPNLVGSDGNPQISEHRFPTLQSMVREAIRLPGAEVVAPDATWLAGTALVLRKTALQSIGGRLDDHYFMYWEDTDLSARLRKAGWDLAICSSALVMHYGGASGGGADASRRADLHAWFCYGKHRWFRANRPTWQAASVWLIDAFDVPRKLIRGSVYKSRRHAEWSHAKVTLQVLGNLLAGGRPKLPGTSGKAQK
jgi:GT2 family glycosyltransferase